MYPDTKRSAIPGQVLVTSLRSLPPTNRHEAMQKGCTWGLRQGSHRQKGYRTEVPSAGKVMGIGTEVTFTIKPLVVLFLSRVLFVEEPWRMKLRLNVLVAVTREASVFSAKKKQTRIRVTRGWTVVTEETPGVQLTRGFVPDVGSRSGPGSD